MLDGSELVRDVQDGHAELPVQPGEQGCEGLLRRDVDSGRGLVEDEQLRVAGERLGHERALLLASGEPGERPICDLGEPDSVDRLLDASSILTAESADEPRARHTARCHDLPHRRRRIETELGALRQVAERAASPRDIHRLAEEPDLAAVRPLEPEREPEQGGLPAAVRARDGDELARFDRQIEAREDRRPVPVPEGHVAELER